MAEGVLYDLAGKALNFLAEPAYKEVVSWWGARDDLKKLEETIKMIQARVHDAERRREGENSVLIKHWLRRLRLVLYQVDDLFDDVLTVDRKRQRMQASKQVCVFFSRSGTLYFNWKISREIKSIRQQLDEIKSDIVGLGLNPYTDLRDEPQPLGVQLFRNRETGSFVKTEDVVGREADKKHIIKMLFDPGYNVEKRITVIPIVGFGGLGKTTLAQLVYNDVNVQKHFNLTAWACVPETDDQNQVLKRVCQSLCNGKDSSQVLVDQIKSSIRESIKDKKYLLVLDDIWDESRDNWLDLLRLLDCGSSGSRVIVTTRSDEVAKAVGTTEPLHLGLLRKEESWNLFRLFAFQPGKEESNPNLVQIGEKIVDSCGNVPLAIRVVGSLLYSENSEEHWQRIRDTRLSKASGKGHDNIMQVLKLSYDYLSPELKQCFAYCSLFPKDYEYSKNRLVKMWMAQGYFEPSSTDTREDYFMELLGRNLFQDHRLREDTYEIDEYCKMHDLVHDLARDIAGEEIKELVGPLDQISFTDGLIHVRADRITLVEDDGWEAPASLLAARKMRSLTLSRLRYHPYTIKTSSLEMMFLKFQSLRVLDLECMCNTEVPKSIGKLQHLRYLSFAWSKIKCLPDDITRLHNLQTLNLVKCDCLTELPGNFCKLDTLRHLNIHGSILSDLPTEFRKMKSLKELDLFIVGKNNGIDSLPPINFTRYMEIIFCEWRSDAVVEAQRAYLKDYQQLTSLRLEFHSMKMNCDLGEMDKLLVSLQLPPNLKFFEVRGYEGVEMPRKWFDGVFHNKLICIDLGNCRNCKVLPHLSRLPHLKKLILRWLDELEYVEDEDDILGDGGKCGSGDHNDYFPSLVILHLSGLRSLKGLTRPSSKADGGQPKRLSFPRLLGLDVSRCPNLMSMPLAPKLESLNAKRINWKVLKSNLTSIDDEEAASPLAKDNVGEPRQLLFPCLLSLTSHFCPKLMPTPKLDSSLEAHQRINWKVSESSNLTSIDNVEAATSSPSTSSTTLYTSLKELVIDEIEDLPASLSISSRLSNLQILEIINCNELTSLMIESSTSIRHLDIRGCKTLKNISMRNLSVLDTLVIRAAGDFCLCDEFEEEIFQSIACLTTLQKLEIEYYDNLKQLPEEMGKLSLLRKLKIYKCPKLESLPQSLLGLTSLQTLQIWRCPMLEERYRNPNGQDCHLLQHIPTVDIRNW